MKTSELLREAQTRIVNPDDWGKLPSMTEEQNCIITALPVWMQYDHAAMLRLQDLLPGNGHSTDALGMYNDAPTTTHADIMELFDWAIGISEAEGD